MATRICSSCHEKRDLEDFPEYKTGRRRGICRACFNDRRTRHGVKNDVSHARPAYSEELKKEKLTVVEEHRLKRRVRELEEKNREIVQQLSEGGEYNEIVREALSLGPKAPAIAPRERKSKLREGTPLVLASDWHVEEEVKPERVAHRNRFNLEIATRRMQRFFEAVRWAVKQQRDTFKIRDLILWLGGDFITNFLHEDDVENNLLPPLQAMRFWMAETIKGFEFLLEDPEIEQVVVPMNDGNHPRLTKKLRAATRVDHSLEVFCYAQIALHFRNEKRLKFILPESQFTYLDNVYGRTIRFLHGDVFRYAGGVGGLTIPLLRAVPRWESVKKADLTCLGHWHQRINLPSVMVNGSLIGYNAFAMSIGCPFEAPSQSLRMLDPARWCGSDIPLWVSSREDDIMTKDK